MSEVQLTHYKCYLAHSLLSILKYKGSNFFKIDSSTGLKTDKVNTIRISEIQEYDIQQDRIGHTTTQL